MTTPFQQRATTKATKAGCERCAGLLPLTCSKTITIAAIVPSPAVKIEVAPGLDQARKVAKISSASVR